MIDCTCVFFFFQAEDGIRDLVRSRGLGDVYKRQTIFYAASPDLADPIPIGQQDKNIRIYGDDTDLDLSLIHI